MGQKINPISLRLQYTNRNFDNCWYSDYYYKNLIARDLFLQNYLTTFLKGVKLDAGRYSFQHLQKKTQIYNFLCYSKSTREWRSKIFGLVQKKNSLRKSRYFLKKSFKAKKNKKGVQLSHFYTRLNQIAAQRIQKKITSFQNLKLWSTLLKVKPGLNTNLSFSFFSQKKDGKSSRYYLRPFSEFRVTGVTKTFGTGSLLDYTQIQGAFKEKSECLKKVNSRLHQKKNSTKIKPSDLISNFFLESQLRLEKPTSNVFRVFLQNLIVYKFLKAQGQSHLKPQNTNRNTRSFPGLSPKYTNYLESSLSSLHKTPIDLISFKVKNDWQNASYLADEIVYFLEKRVSFRVIKGKLLKQLLKNPQIRGIRITCSGRVGGKSKKAQRAKTECVKYGQTSLQVFSSKLDFAVKTAFTSFGSVGVKVWICYN